MKPEEPKQLIKEDNPTTTVTTITTEPQQVKPDTTRTTPEKEKEEPKREKEEPKRENVEPKRDRSPIKVESAEANSTCGGENDFLIRFVFNKTVVSMLNIKSFKYFRMNKY